MPKSMFWDVFWRRFFDCVLASILDQFLDVANLKNRAPASTGARFLQNRRFRKVFEKCSILVSFPEVKTTKNEENMMLKNICSSMLFDFAWILDLQNQQLLDQS